MIFVFDEQAKAALRECVSEFINFVTSEAADRLVEDKRKTITGDDGNHLLL
jgi:nuclear transcription Y subunit beta